jgi:7,8-dihydroneopterin aldolase/epimerase/oxygenase
MEEMRYKTSLSGLEFFAYHGLYAEERVLGALFLVEISVEYEIDQPITNIDEATNYELILSTVKEVMAVPQDLIEVVAQHMIVALKQLFVDANQIQVTIHKPNPAGVFKSGVASVTMSS